MCRGPRRSSPRSEARGSAGRPSRRRRFPPGAGRRWGGGGPEAQAGDETPVGSTAASGQKPSRSTIPGYRSDRYRRSSRPGPSMPPALRVSDGHHRRAIEGFFVRALSCVQKGHQQVQGESLAMSSTHRRSGPADRTEGGREGRGRHRAGGCRRSGRSPARFRSGTSGRRRYGQGDDLLARAQGRIGSGTTTALFVREGPAGIVHHDV